MKIVSHNINGLNAYVNNNKLERILEMDADVYCFQEVKCSDPKKLERLLDITIDDYDAYHSINTAINGYAGVTTLIKRDIKYIRTEIVQECLEGVSDYGKGRIIMTEFDKFYLINVYGINSAGEQKTVDRIRFDYNFSLYINRLQKNKPVIVCGDFNVCHTNLDYWGNFEKTTNTLPGLMQFERDSFDNLLNNCDLIDIFRELYPAVSLYSWFPARRSRKCKHPWELRHGWRLDYFLVNKNLIKYVKDSDIYEAWNQADHSPISIDLNNSIL